MQTKQSQQLKKINEGSIVSPLGFTAAGIHTKVKRKRKDLGMILCEVPAESAAVYTLNQITAAPLQVTKDSIAAEGKIQAVIINSGNANACMGKQGTLDAISMRNKVAETFQLQAHHVAVASTGVIGEPMPMDKIIPGIESLSLDNGENAALDFQEAILTTDTCPKSTCYQIEIEGKTITMAGAAKGSGMIAPNMATMLGFITTDANIAHPVLQQALRDVTDQTFNRITVDGDTSTNDMVLVMASGLAENAELTPEHPEWSSFKAMLKQVCEDLAIMIARDGEGATKLIEVHVEGADNDVDAGIVAKSVVGSNLVKTMVYGSDPNWGRVMMAIGKSGAKLNPETIDITLGTNQLLVQSQPAPYEEEQLVDYLKNEKVIIAIDLHLGNGTGKAWGCDLTYDYVRINASYRT
ncbi:bifunctional glutamate N-acetyltransferase/amino-acid acetyltransferase ArgJ [Bacillus sp. FJAT-50079]|uniref:bifunctional glutamate N-acetyltransferase/amino-acid acetyltransferase ArgJ n=1 Tax=Bacillus sp. FJAT-50079 TaxID=2833577 RepID=UPI001BC96C84|nr:bifunctional glutamate N-acetyltransferase/amino-acid acetyltransferase ArgJ [Bacillus sp. FJAT-50079]MBS4207405.1 bifunctional glutamate N-acetyltransferase/amino-acid acetyltransferase ArgJ [Bacillus sp. FJAT-50079]